MSLLTVKNIEKSYFNRVLFSNLSLSIERGERLAILGDNGAGKTTLFKILSGMETPDSGDIIRPSQFKVTMLSQKIEDEISDDEAWVSLEWKQAAKEITDLTDQISKTYDNPDEHSALMKKYDSALRKFDALGGWNFEYELKSALSGLGLPEDIMQRGLSSCSGGEKMRITMAKKLLERPDLLLLDEPTNHLDLMAIEWLIDYLSTFKGAVCVISHDRYFLDKTVKRCGFLNPHGIKIYLGNYSEASKTKNEEDIFNASKMNSLEKEIERQKEVVSTLLSHRNISSYHARQKIVEKLEDKLQSLKNQSGNHISKLHKLSITAKSTESNDSHIILEASKLTATAGNRTLFENLSLTIRSKDKIVIIGPNGCGKSTLIEFLCGNSSRVSGTVKIDPSITVGYMSQLVSFDDEDKTVIEYLIEQTDLNETKARNRLGNFGFRDIEVFKKISTLSGGERSRLYMSVMLFSPPSLLILDEPTNHLDISSKEVLEQALSNYDGSIILVTHDRFLIDKICDKIYAFEYGKIIEYDDIKKAILKQRLCHQCQGGPTASDKTVKEISETNHSPYNTTPNIKEHENNNQYKKAKTASKNRAEIRKESAAIKLRISQIEKKIDENNNIYNDIQQSLSPQTPPDVYEKMNILMTENQNLEEEYLELSIKLEDMANNADS